jgi:cytochrome b pre-mRNA-processing protein 3
VSPDSTQTIKINYFGMFNDHPKEKLSDLLQRASRLNTSRAFSSTVARPLEPNPGPNATPRTSIPPVDPARAEGGPKAQTPVSIKAAAGLKKVAGRATETYTAYGSTELLYKECAVQADYSIPQAGKDEQETPKTESGEDLGVGSGWWHTGRSSWATNSN